mmetsp:Transcript_11437/g.26898  ORF Transcript_11437/g.26898 Transcript_11437/m.26898 type:complete len:305 (-) Transcript_11437:672-1586(-)
MIPLRVVGLSVRASLRGPLGGIRVRTHHHSAASFLVLCVRVGWLAPFALQVQRAHAPLHLLFVQPIPPHHHQVGQCRVEGRLPEPRHPRGDGHHVRRGNKAHRHRHRDPPWGHPRYCPLWRPCHGHSWVHCEGNRAHRRWPALVRRGSHVAPQWSRPLTRFVRDLSTLTHERGSRRRAWHRHGWFRAGARGAGIHHGVWRAVVRPSSRGHVVGVANLKVVWLRARGEVVLLEARAALLPPKHTRSWVLFPVFRHAASPGAVQVPAARHVAGLLRVTVQSRTWFLCLEILLLWESASLIFLRARG